VTITARSADSKAEGEAPYVSVSFKTYSAVTKIAIDRSKLTVGVGSRSETGKISVYEVLPEDATDASVRWTANNDNVYLSVGSDGGFPEIPVPEAGGEEDAAAEEEVTRPEEAAAAADVVTKPGEVLLVKGLLPGVTKLTGVTIDGSNKKVTCTVTVRGQVSGVRLKTVETRNGINNVKFYGSNGNANYYDGNMKANSKLTLKAMVDIGGVPADSTDKAKKATYSLFKKYTDVTIVYYSGNPQIATVSKDGKVSVSKTARPGDNVRIYAVSSDGACTAIYGISVVE
jgi:hypothetical protein